jgi:hypothetical protein
MLRVVLERDELAVVRQGASHPDRRVAGESPDLEDPPRANHPRQQVQELAHRRIDLDRRQTRGIRALDGLAQRVVFRNCVADDPTVDVRPARIGHAGTRSGAKPFFKVKLI